MLRRRLVLVILLAAAPAIGKPSGRVVRVEQTGEGRVPPRVCELRRSGATCVGDAPLVGQVIAVLDEHGVVAEATVSEASHLIDGCPQLWKVRYELERGALPDGGSMGVIDATVDRQRAHIVEHDLLPASPSGLPGDQVWQGIDRDGDGTADILFTQYLCDAEGNQVSAGHGLCLDLWARMRNKLIRTSQINFARCNL